ncbi:MAG TPA: ABC transporter permease [Terriglobia bacterium]|jgi:putative ABC transport system permease protein|nr:ABC transporter permease [Terriglobia bacterium]
MPTRIVNFFRNLWRRNTVEQALDDELQSSVELLTEGKMKEGFAHSEARRQALIELGGVEQVKEEVRGIRAARLVEDLAKDVRYGLRQLRRNPGFTTVVVLTLTLGIGATTAIFSIVNAVLLRPLPFKDAARLAVLHEAIPKLGYPKMGFSAPDLAIYEREQKSFSDLGAYQDKHVEISGHGEPERMTAARVSASLFPMLGAQPMLGRTFAPDEDATGHPVAILSYRLWQKRYGGSRDALSQTIEVDRQPYTVIGVMPRDFVFPLASADDNGSPADLWIPMAFTPTELQGWGGSYLTSVLGRLRAGVTLGQVRGENEALARRIVASYPGGIADFVRRGQLAIAATPFQEEVVASERTLLLVLMAAVGLVLLIACANVATLLLSRAAARERELSVRAALGASRLRLLRQMLTESLLLALGGGVLGFLFAVWGRNVLLAMVPLSVPLPGRVPLSGGVLGFAAGASLLCGIALGLVPAFRAPLASVSGALQESGRGATTSRAHHRLQGFFVTAEFALAFVLLVGAGLLMRSFLKLLETNPGFRPDHVLTMNVPLPAIAYVHASEVENFYMQLLDKASSLPGVESAALSNDLPLREIVGVSYIPEGQANGAGETPEAVGQTWVLGNYFQTMGVPLLQGRWFTPEDRPGSERVAIVNLSAARKFWPGRNALDKRLRWGGGPWQVVVGVVGNVNEGGLDTAPAPHVYRPYLQADNPFLEQDPFGDMRALNLALRTHEDPASLITAAVAQVHSLDPDVAVTRIRTMTQVLSSTVAGPEFNTWLLGTFAGVALLLAAIGIYGVLAYSVAQQIHEIGIRMALGAEKRDVLTLVVGRGFKLTLMGVAIGIAGSFAVTRFLSSLLYGVKPTDPFTFFAGTLVLAGVSLLATYIPTRRATKVDPMVALRYE